MKLPEKGSLVTQTILVLQDMMREGELVSPIPGERALASELHIGRDTLRAALHELTKNGWISESTQGKRRRILKVLEAQAPCTTTKSRVIFICPQRLEEFPRTMLLELNQLRGLLSKVGITIDVINPSIFDTVQPKKRLEQLIIDYKADAWVLYRCPKPVQHWFQTNNIPCIVRGYPHPDISLPFIDEDWKAAAFHAGSRLINNGHKSIAIIVPDVSLEGLRAAEKGLKEAIQQLGNNQCSYQVIKEKQEIGSTIQAMQKALASPVPPTAVLVTRARHVLNLTSWLATFGYSVPEHLSLVALCSEPWFDELYSPITHYASSPATIAKSLSKQVRHLLNDTPISANNSFIIPELKNGASVKVLNVQA